MIYDYQTIPEARLEKDCFMDFILYIFLLIIGPYNRGDKGFPLNYYFAGGGGCYPKDSIITCFDMPPSFSLVYLLIDIIYYYLLSCLIVWIYDKVRKKKMKKV